MAEIDQSLPLDQQDQQAQRFSLEADAKGIQLLDELLLLINSGAAVLDGKQHDRGLNFLIGLILARSFNTLWRGRQDIVQGYPVQAMTLARAALEDWIAIRWLEEHPEERDLWLCWILAEIEVPLDVRGRERWVPSADKMLDELSEGDEPLEAYRQLSKIAHPRGVGIGWQFHLDGQLASVHCGPHFDAYDLRRTLFFLIRITAGMLPQVESLQTRWLGTPDGEWVGRTKPAVGRAVTYLDQVMAEIVATEGGRRDQ